MSVECHGDLGTPDIGNRSLEDKQDIYEAPYNSRLTHSYRDKSFTNILHDEYTVFYKTE